MNLRMLPPSRPQQPREATAAILLSWAVRDTVALLGTRGYYRDTLGAKGRNDLGLYDDAIFVISPSVYATFNANVDPSRDGWNAKVGKPMAQLAPGLWRYRVGTHKTYTALVQAGPVTVRRGAEATETGWFGINIHRGGRTTTSSEGCQTIHPDQWEGFIALVRSELKRHGQTTLPYLLTENAS